MDEIFFALTFYSKDKHIQDMKLRLAIIMIMFFGKNFAQNITDTVFHNVIRIDDKQMLSESRDENANILIDIAIPSSYKKPVIFVVPNIPIKRLQYIYPEFSEIILITPNHSLYKKMSPSKGEPAASSVLYNIQRSGENIKIDSLVIRSSFPKMNYYENPLEGDYTEDFEYHQQESGNIKVFYQDVEPLNLENEVISLKESISKYEKKFEKKIHYYQKYNRKYQFFENYYTMEGLTKKEKLEFILHRRWAVIANKSVKEIVFSPMLITPYWVKIDKKFTKNGQK